MFRNLIEKSALGRVAKIGALYDVRTDAFVNDSIFTSKLDEDDIDVTDISETSTELVMGDSIQEKFKKLNIDRQLRASVLAGMVKICGAGSYLTDEGQSAKTQRMSLLYQLKTVQEEIVIKHHKDKIDVALLDGESNATHVVISIDWGACCSICCEYINREEKNVSEIKENIAVELSKIKSLLDTNTNGDLTYDERNREQNSNFKFKCHYDVSVPNRELTVTFDDAVELVRKLPSLLRNTNDGKGVPQVYMLMPLDQVAKLCKRQIQHQIVYISINEETIKRYAQVMDEITNKRQILFDIRRDLHDNGDYVKSKSLKHIDQAFDDFVNEEYRFRNKLRQVLTRARSIKEDIYKLDELLKGLPEMFTDDNFNITIRSFEKIMSQIKDIKMLKSKGIIYLGKAESFNPRINTKTYILYKACSDSSTCTGKRAHQFFLKLQRAHRLDFNFIIVDQDICQEVVWPPEVGVSVIHYYDGYNKISMDVYKELSKDFETCLIEIGTLVHDQTLPSTAKRHPVRIPCPKAFLRDDMCEKDIQMWKCSKCKSIVSYGTEKELFHCDCGWSDPSEAKWRCNGKYHGLAYAKSPEKDILFKELEHHKATKEINILILGETGVGKSTWINSFYNYIAFGDITDALKESEVHHLIPSSFTAIDKVGADMVVKRIKVGVYDNSAEREKIGQAATQYPCSHLFYVGDNIVRLIDTPGVGDPRGIEKDKENFENILRHLTYYEQIHAVCILMKPDIARLNVLFRFCIQELLSHLSTSVKNNIVFCFTHSRATLYTPGETLPSLNAELKEMDTDLKITPENYFCFDSESFRFLASKQNGIQFKEEDEVLYAQSWKRSVAETRRLFDHISELTPHNTRTTLSMNESRRIIAAMDRPLGDVTKMIQLNIEKGEEIQKELDSCGMNLRLLKRKLNVKGYDLEYIKLDGSRIVCTHNECVDVIPVGEARVSNTIYKHVCREGTWFAFNFLRFINLGRCKNCLHRWKEHRYITYDTKIVETEFLSQEIQAEIKSMSNVEAASRLMKTNIDEKTSELRKEEQFILETAAKFASFYKANALVVCNDAFDDYIEMLINVEQQKPKDKRDVTFIDRMKTIRERYNREKETIEKALKESTENRIIPKDIVKRQQDLFNLKHMGKTFKNLHEKISLDHDGKKMGCSEKIATIRNSKQSSSGYLDTIISILGKITSNEYHPYGNQSYFNYMY